MRAYVYGARAPTENAELVREQIFKAHRYKNKLVEIELARRAARGTVLKPHIDARAEQYRVARERGENLKLPKLELSEAEQKSLDNADEASRAAVRAARAECGVYWGTYLTVEDAAGKQREGRHPPRFKRYNGTGAIAVQLPAPMHPFRS